MNTCSTKVGLHVKMFGGEIGKNSRANFHAHGEATLFTCLTCGRLNPFQHDLLCINIYRDVSTAQVCSCAIYNLFAKVLLLVMPFNGRHSLQLTRNNVYFFCQSKYLTSSGSVPPICPIKVTNMLTYTINIDTHFHLYRV